MGCLGFVWLGLPCLDPNQISQQARRQGYLWSYRNSRNFESHSDSDFSNRRWSVADARFRPAS